MKAILIVIGVIIGFVLGVMGLAEFKEPNKPEEFIHDFNNNTFRKDIYYEANMRKYKEELATYHEDKSNFNLWRVGLIIALIVILILIF
jgi:hypothetical protein